MLTLCRLVEPVSIRPPQSPHLRPFTFFTSRARQQDGSEHVHLHMGFFETLADAEKWARAARSRHPDAIATIAPPAFWQLSDSDEPASSLVDNVPLTDTQVLNILETRGSGPGSAPASIGDARDSEQIEMLRPEDTGTRRALKEAVARGAPVSFAVQLHWSTRSIDPLAIPALTLFKGHTVYTVESRRGNRSCFFLRLGFFGDPASAKRVAALVRSSFAAAAVVPVLDEEIARAREACLETSLVPCIVQQRTEHVLDTLWAAPPKSASTRRRTHGAETLEETLALLAERELLNDPDLLSDTGVRHLKVEIEKRVSGRRH